MFPTSRSRSRSFAVALVATLCTAAVPAAASATVAARSPGMVPVSGGGQQDLHVAFVLRYRNERELQHLVVAQGDPRSPSFHAFLTPAQFRARYAPVPADVARVERALAAAGIVPVRVHGNGSVVDALAPEATLARFFDTTFSEVRTAAGTARIASRPPRVPASLRDVIAGVGGLTDARALHAQAVQRNAPLVEPAKASPPPLDGPKGGYGPWATIDGYGLRQLSGIDGTGVTVALVIAATASDADVNTYLSYFGIPRSGPPTTVVPINGGCPPNNPYGKGCVMPLPASLDLEQLVANAPGVRAEIDSLPSEGPTDPLVDAYAALDDRDDVPVVLTPWQYTYCESYGQSDAMAINALFEQGSALGITFVVSDVNSSTCGPFNAALPADSPFATALGGSALQLGLHGGYGGESAYITTGGGASSLFTPPPYQLHVKNADPQLRSMPDISIASTVGVVPPDFVFRGRWTNNYIDNDNAGEFGALLAEAIQYEGSREGLLNLRMYAALRAGGAYRTAFNDITNGCGIEFCAEPGFDYVSGIGSLRGLALWENTR